MHSARVDVLRAIQTGSNGSVRDTAAQRLQVACIEYYYELRPLSDNNAVRGLWQDAMLWVERRVVGSPPNAQMKDVEVRGLDELERVAMSEQETVEETEGFLGTQKRVKRQPETLSIDILLRVSYLLDKAAAKLGMQPDIDEDVMSAVLEDGAPVEDATDIKGAKTDPEGTYGKPGEDDGSDDENSVDGDGGDRDDD